MSNGTLAAAWAVYRLSLRKHAHQLLAWAHSDVRTRIDANSDEPAITGLLCEAMKARINDDSTPEVYLHYAIGDQVPISPTGQLGNERLRLDITVLRTGVRPQPSYIFEAKRLHTGSFTIGEYVGEGGMGDFIECRYAVGIPEAAMVGLVQDKDVAYWHTELTRVFAADNIAKAPKLGIRRPLNPVNIHSYIASEWESDHTRKDSSSLHFLHIFLDCC